MKNAILTAGLIAIFVASLVQVAHAEVDGKFSLETGMDSNSGTYGRTQSTDILYVPVIGKYQGKTWSLKLTIPYLQITGPGNVINGVGVTGAAAANTRVTQSGLGDVVVAASNNIYNDVASGVMVNLTGKVKLGTADSAKGLGSGKNDYAFQSDLYQVKGNLTGFGTFGYRVYGSPAAYTLNNVFYGWLGGSYKFGQETHGGIMLNLSQKIITTGSSHTEVIAFVSHKLADNWKAQGYVLKGFTNSVPNWGFGANATYVF
ncbi:MAG: hypothetical protein PXX77_07585 [Gallionella sp.]|nr:hypothetical protein [Gallionella sp.]